MIWALLQEWKDRLQGGLVALMLGINHPLVSDINLFTAFPNFCAQSYII